MQWETGVVALQEEGASYVRVPVGIMAVVALGPGTSITQAAAHTLYESGACVMFTGGGGYPAYSAAAPLTSSARWAEAQARCWASADSRLDAARALYTERFGEDFVQGLSLETLRGLEGQAVKSEYARLRKKHRIPFKRDHLSVDPVNASLNLGNSLLYGVARAVCSALQLSPALGIIHQGHANAFLFDLADVYKLKITVPVAFASASAEDPMAFTRRHVRSGIHSRKAMAGMLEISQRIFAPYAEMSSEGLFNGEGAAVQGHRNHA